MLTFFLDVIYEWPPIITKQVLSVFCYFSNPPLISVQLKWKLLRPRDELPVNKEEASIEGGESVKPDQHFFVALLSNVDVNWPEIAKLCNFSTILLSKYEFW